MIVRKIKPEELKRTQELFAIAFEYSYDNKKPAQQIYEDSLNNPKSREDETPLNKYAAFEDDDCTMTSCLSAIAYKMNFDGKQTAMAAVGGVSSLPQYRRKGGIRGCFEKMLPDLYEQNIEFSYLYPFSSVYYRKFGFEMGCFGKKCNYLLSMIPEFDLEGGYCVLADESNRDKVIKDVKKLYEQWEKQYNGMIDNGTYEYTFITAANPYESQEFTYIYYRRNHEPAAYFSFRKEKTKEGQIINCHRLVYADKEGLQGFLTLVKTMASDHVRVLFTVPYCEPMEYVVKEWSLGAFSESILPLGMVRAVNVMQVFRKAKYRGSGSLVIEITDACIPQNQGVYEIEFLDGGISRIVFNPKGKKTQIRMDISDFSHGIFRGFEGGEVFCYDSVKVFDERILENGILTQIFYPKKNYIMEYF